VSLVFALGLMIIRCAQPSPNTKKVHWSVQ